MKTKIDPQILCQVANDPTLLAKVIVGLYRRQTEVEQKNKRTTEKNLRGFYPRDAAFLTTVAEAAVAGLPFPQGREEEIKRRVLIYRRQVCELVRGAN